MKKKLGQGSGIDRSLSFLWKNDRYVTSECENYLSAIQEQELPTKYLRYDGSETKVIFQIPTINLDCVCVV